MEAEQRACGFLQARTRADTLADALSETPDLAAGIERRAPMLLTWFGCTALLGRILANPSATAPKRTRRLPARPAGSDPVRLEDTWASAADPVGVYLFGDARADFTGAVHLPLSPDGGDYLVLGRPERTRTVVWAGGPPTPGAGEKDLTPRARSRHGARRQRPQPALRRFDHQLAVEIRRRLIDRLLLDDRRNRALELERRVAERTRELAEARAAAERASNAKTRFLAAASHDLRQPLQAGVIFHSVLSRRNQDPRQAEVIEQLGRSLEVLQGLLEGMLDISRIDAGIVAPERQVFPVQSILDQLIVEFAGCGTTSACAARQGVHSPGLQ